MTLRRENRGTERTDAGRFSRHFAFSWAAIASVASVAFLKTFQPKSIENPLTPFTTHTGTVATMDRANVDTDQIIPKQFLKRIERTGFGQFLFFDWRSLDDGSDNPEFELNAEATKGASILVARENFGSGSSREHAVWALTDYGFRCVISSKFADIFFNNSFKNGFLPIILSESEVDKLFALGADQPGFEMTVDLLSQMVTVGDVFSASFEIEPFRKDCLLNGIDDIGLTLKQLDKIEKFEAVRGYAKLD